MFQIPCSKHVLVVTLLVAGFVCPAPFALAQEGAEAEVDGATVAESAICTQVEDRVPVGAAETFPATVDRLFCFTDLRGAAGTTVSHVWIHEGTTRARVDLEVRGDRWRTWSSKQILPEWTGSWEVKVLTAEGAVLHTLSFTVE
jgi:hypothetical protein